MWESLLVSLVLMVVSAALTAAAKPSSQVQKTEPGKLDIPTATEGEPVSVIFGTCLVKSGNVIWYGDASTKEIKSKGQGSKK